MGKIFEKAEAVWKYMFQTAFVSFRLNHTRGCNASKKACAFMAQTLLTQTTLTKIHYD